MTPWLGILMLDTRLPRVAGDVGHRDSWRMPVRFRTVAGASPQRAVRERDPASLPPFIEAALALQADGAPAPLAGAIERATGRPVHHLITLVHQRWEPLQ